MKIDFGPAAFNCFSRSAYIFGLIGARFLGSPSESSPSSPGPPGGGGGGGGGRGGDSGDEG
ncbi:MAG: hypothetical protein DI536_14460 [Archangium gephyra]|uniref:Uncharacterized protein n=1 Tax=Archangium gephyra TaxID=48 RepID=A0A2W5UU90_9BACT|nr:MAG: hypothetical protein DI536_14460 [Archangium gephyra]